MRLTSNKVKIFYQSPVNLTGRAMVTVKENSWYDFINKQKRIFIDKVLSQTELLSAIRYYTPLGSKILEVGCGTGLISMLLSQVYEVTATDVNREIVKQAKKNADTHSFKLNFKIVSVFNLPYKYQSFHTVFSQGLLEHFEDNEIIQALKEQKRVGKIVIFDVPTKNFGKHPFGDERLLSVSYWKRLVSKSGLRIIKIYGRDYKKIAYIFPFILARKYGYIFSKKVGIICK